MEKKGINCDENRGMSRAAARTGNFKKIVVINGKNIGMRGSYENDHKTRGAGTYRQMYGKIGSRKRQGKQQWIIRKSTAFQNVNN